jgi:hypothetical protein
MTTNLGDSVVHAVAQPGAIDQSGQTIRTLQIHLGNSKRPGTIVMVQLIGDFRSIFVCSWGFDHAGTSCADEMAGRRSR